MNHSTGAKSSSSESPALQPTVINFIFEIDDELDFGAAKARGGFDNVEPNATTRHFTIENNGRGKRQVSASLVCFHRLLFDEEGDSEVDREIAKLNIGRRGGPQAILAFAAEHKEIQLTKYIVSSLCSGPTLPHTRHFLALYGHNNQRYLFADEFKKGYWWDESCWFLVLSEEE